VGRGESEIEGLHHGKQIAERRALVVLQFGEDLVHLERWSIRVRPVIAMVVSMAGM
jgi:hypothetical protein